MTEKSVLNEKLRFYLFVKNSFGSVFLLFVTDNLNKMKIIGVKFVRI